MVQKRPCGFIVAISVIFLFSAIFICRTGRAEIILSPEMTIKLYFDAYIVQDWEVCTEYFHPDLLQKLHDRIIDMVREVSVITRAALLRQYHVRSVKALEAMPPRQLYILYLKNRWEGLDAQTVQGLSSTKLSFIKTKIINHDECQVEFKTTFIRDNQSFDKIEAYRLKKYEDRWKIYDTEGLKQLEKKNILPQKRL